MRIKELFIKRYGPLRDRSYVLADKFTLFFGKNEEGKTLTIDALVKLLLGRHSKDFERIDRVEETPEGYLVVEDDQGQEVKLPEKGILTDLAQLTPSECRNLFVIRNSDLSILPENEFYTGVTDRLVGVRTDEISKIREALRDIGKVTPGGSFRDMKDEKLKTRIESATDLINRIEALAAEIREGGYDKLEEEAADCKDKRDHVAEGIEELEVARKREKYERGRDTLTSLKDALSKLQDLRVFTFDTAQLWRDCEKDTERLIRERQGLERDIKKEEAELKKTGDKLSKKERDFQTFEDIKKTIDDEVRQDLVNYERNRQEFERRKGKSKLLTWTWLVAAGLLGISLAAVLLRPSPIFLILAPLFLAATAGSWILKYMIVRSKTLLDDAFERMRLTLSTYELGAENIEGILSSIKRFELAYRRKGEELQDIRRRQENLRERIKDLRHRLMADIEKKLGESARQIDSIVIQSTQKTLEDYTEKLRLKDSLERLSGELQSVLTSHFGKMSEELGQNLEYWEKEVSAFEEYRDKVEGLRYSEEAMLGLEGERQHLDEKLEEMNHKIGSFKKSMADVERRVNEILRLEDEYLHCRTLVDLEAVKKELRKFIDENETKRVDVLRAIAIFEEIEMEEREKVSQLFDRESQISEYFGKITGGRYDEVTLNQEIGEIEVIRRDGVRLGAEKLSGGAYDQLYLSIRLALGEKLMEGKKGFFILDDPFIKADPNRLRMQIDVLRRISDGGWQIIYFSAKEEVQSALADDIKKGVVNRIEIQGMVS
ncbi:MAG: AAA family ATPase [Proteobacteria bacterium]|nr:AAA family ATPase [Pseudomonadota bacterium]